MKTKIVCGRWVMAWLGIAWLVVSAAAQRTQVNIQVICSFTNGPGNPAVGLVQGPDGNFYGTTDYGGSGGAGTVFRVTTSGVLTTLVSFPGNNDGRNLAPSGLTLGPDGNLYGTTAYGGGGFGNGTVFRVTTNGILTTVAGFDWTNGAYPYSSAGLTLGADGSFYGTTDAGGSNGAGTVFKVTTDGILTTLFSFAATTGSAYTNDTGASPAAGLTLGPNGNFYGATASGGSSGYGTVFKITPDGTLTTLVNFANTNLNGAHPAANLTLGPDGNFYGTTFYGGSSGGGTVFKVTTNGVFTTVASLPWTHGFVVGSISRLTVGLGGNFYGTLYGGTAGFGILFKMLTNGNMTTLVTFYGQNGENPAGDLRLGQNGQFYGTTFYGGRGGGGTVFEVTTNGTLATLVHFDDPFDNATPQPSLTLGTDGNFYGMTEYGGTAGDGTVLKVTTSGTLTTLADFVWTNGAFPEAALALGPDGSFYGTTEGGGKYGQGTTFRVTTNGMLTTLASFGGSSGLRPYAGLTLGPDGLFYGTTCFGGSGGYGTVFRMTTNGTLTTLVNFDNANGANPYAGLTLGPDGNFYGTTSGGFTSGQGTIFKVTTNGTLTTLLNFTGTNGARPYAALTLGPDGNFYGTTAYGGSNYDGTVFRVTTNGMLTTLASFGGNNAYGERPYAALTLGPDGNFYGTTEYGGDGTVFQVTTNGTVTTLAVFGNYNGEYPRASLTLGPDGNLYGTTASGGGGAGGVIYRLSNLQPIITRQQPISQTSAIGGTANFTVSAGSISPLAYQWYFNDGAIAGATNAVLAFGPVSTNDAGDYQVVVTNFWGSVTSRVATLTVLLQPNPYGISRNVGGGVTLSLASIPGSTNRLWATTNLNLPLPQWRVIATEVTTNGFFQFTDTNMNSGQVKFYRLSTP